jgi:hypothetical protein
MPSGGSIRHRPVCRWIELQQRMRIPFRGIKFAYELVLKDLEARRLTGDGDAGLIAQAAAALAALRKPAG